MKSKVLAVIHFLQSNGVSTSADIQAAFKISQPTAARILASLEDEIFTFGAARSSRYALGHSIGALPAQQPIWMIDPGGICKKLGTLTFLSKSQIHLGAEGVNLIFDATTREPLPWVLSGLRPQGYLGRILAQRMSTRVSSSSPDTWSIEEVLLGACQTHDAPGALFIGEQTTVNPDAAARISATDPGPDLDRLSMDVATTLPAGSSAGGEQPKLLAFNDAGDSFVVKFSAPHGTPFGERWTDLLVCEAISAQTLNDFGVAAAPNEIIQTESRTYLLSRRFDRVLNGGRRHVISIGAAHSGLCQGPYIHWASTCDALVRQNRLSNEDAERTRDILMFGRLIGNADMHSGNAGLFVKGISLQEMLKGEFSLAPVYDMLPMRWKPDAMMGTFDYQPFEADHAMASQEVRRMAQTFWTTVSSHPLISKPLRSVAREMGTRMGV